MNDKKMKHQVVVCLDIVIKNIDWICLSIAQSIREEILSLIKTTWLSCLRQEDEVTFITPYHIQVLHSFHDMDEVYQLLNHLDDATYKIPSPYVYERLFLGIGICVLQEQEDISLGMANAQFARICDLDANKLHTHIALFDADKRLALLHWRHVEHAMRVALAQQDFTFYLQPKIPLQEDGSFQAEALFRCPSLSPSISTVELIQIAESNGLIRDLDFLMFEAVLKYQSNRFVHQEPLFPISVNISRYHFEDVTFFERYLNLLRSYHIPPSCIEFEITESISSTHHGALAYVLAQMHQAGIRCSLDDFGCGSSSLASLKNLPFDAIKLDRQFFLQEDTRSDVIVKACIDMAKGLQQAVIAEGVSSLSQVEKLKQWGCDYVQAYLYAKPMHPQELDSFYQEWKLKKHSLFS